MDNELKKMLDERAEEVRVDPNLPRPVLRRARRRRFLTGAMAGLTAAVVVAGAAVGIQTALNGRAAPANTPSLSRSSSTTPTTTDPKGVALAFAHAQMGWDGAGLSAKRTDLSQTEVRIDLWNLAVTKRAGVDPQAPDFAISFTLDQRNDGTWDITDVRTGLIDLVEPSSRQDVLAVGKPQDLSGTLKWTPAEGIVNGVLYVGDLPTEDNPSPPSVACQAPISFPDFHGRFGFVPGGAESAFLVVRLVDPEGVTIGLMARKMVLEPSP
jgi:hypothetical protein